jgi:tetratricopeptide (TPR) repeat protein
LDLLPIRRRLAALLCCWTLFHAAGALAQAPGSPAGADPMLSLLQQMVAEDPTRADSWRLIGRIHRQHNRVPEAIDAFRRALAQQPDNAAAHHDFGELMAQLGDHSAAAFHFDQVMLLAPSSSYAARLVERGIRPPPRMAAPVGMPIMAPPPAGIPNLLGGSGPTWGAEDVAANGARDLTTVGYEIQTFDGADDLERRLNQLESDVASPAKTVRAFVELGALYNTNVALTPISRELTGNAAASFQGFLSPDLEWIALSAGRWRSGPLLRGYFTVNEDDFRSLNLASFQPGAFLERDASWGASEVIGRVDYVYSLDLLDGDRFGDRHALTASLTTILPEADVIYAYVTASRSEFAEDGADPAVDSLDGTAVSGGVSRFFQTGWELLPTWSLGADAEWADTEGADFRYRAVNLHGDTTFQLTERLSFTPRGGIGYRNYPDFTGPVSRDELTWRASGRLRWRWTEWLSTSAVVNHDRFASDNEEFDTERTEAGVVLTLLR